MKRWRCRAAAHRFVIAFFASVTDRAIWHIWWMAILVFSSHRRDARVRLEHDRERELSAAKLRNSNGPDGPEAAR
jgi:hypothetical protein